jgi:hypothetical protein
MGDEATSPSDPDAAAAQARAPMSREEKEHRVELIAAILLSIATIVTAWAAYQATRWSGEQARHYVTASATRTESVRDANRANAEILVDVDTFLAWLDAERAGNDALATDIRDRMRAEFLPVFEAWLSGAPAGEIPDGTPFARSDYVLQTQKDAVALEAEASAEFDAGQRANQISDNFVLAAVLFASVLFFAGLGGTFDTLRVQVFLLILAGIMLIGGVVVVVSLPQNVGF